MTSIQETVRKRIGHFVSLNPALSKADICRHFLLEGIPKRTTYRVLRRISDGKTLDRKLGGGRPAKIMTKRHQKELEKDFSDKDKISQTTAASKYKCSQPYICKILKKKLKIKCYKKQKSPGYTDEQIVKVKSQCRWFYRKSQITHFTLTYRRNETLQNYSSVDQSRTFLVIWTPSSIAKAGLLKHTTS